MTKNHEFDRIYDEYKNLVLKAAYNYTKDLELAEDVMQDTFLALYRDMDAEKELKDYTNLKSWLYTTAKHKAINYKKKYSRELYVDEESEKDADIFDSPGESTEEEYFDTLKQEKYAELHERIFSDLEEKNPQWHEVIMLTCYLKIPQVEAAKMLGMNADALYVMLHRIRKWIRQNYGAEYEELNRM